MKLALSRPAVGALLMSGCLGTGFAQGPSGVAPAPRPAAPMTLFENVRVFDGKSGTVSGQTNVLVRGPTIARISGAPIAVDATDRATVIAGGGRVLMPGLIDAHWHAMLVRPTPTAAIMGDVGFISLIAGAEATDTLMRGFTTVRDLGGPA